MITVFDDASYWLLSSLSYDGQLVIKLAEGIIGPAEEMVINNMSFPGMHPVLVDKQSKLFKITFSKTVAWQVVNETFTTLDKDEKRDNGKFLNIVSNSGYLEYVKQYHGWFEQVLGPGHHYRLITAKEIIDVVSCAEPHITTGH